MSYIQRIATLSDVSAIAPLWKAFALARSQADPSMRLKAEFDYERYVTYQLKKPLSFGFLLEYVAEIVGFVFIYIYESMMKLPLLKFQL